MVTLTRLLHVVSAVILVLTGAYVHFTFGALMATEAVVSIWVLSVLYLGGQLEKNYRIVTKLLVLLYK